MTKPRGNNLSDRDPDTGENLSPRASHESTRKVDVHPTTGERSINNVIAPEHLEDDMDEEWPPQVANYGEGSFPDATVRDPGGLLPDDIGFAANAIAPETLDDDDIAPVINRDASSPWSNSDTTGEVLTSAADTTSRKQVSGAVPIDELERKTSKQQPVRRATADLPRPEDALPDSAAVQGSIETPIDVEELQPKKKASAPKKATSKRSKTPSSEKQHRSHDPSHTPPGTSERRFSSSQVIFLTASITLLMLGGIGVVLFGVFTMPQTSDSGGGGGGGGGGGSLLVRTKETAACTIYLDSKPTRLLAPGKSLLLSSLATRKHVVSVRCIGYETYEATAEVKAGEVTLVEAKLRALQK